ncbi:MAG: lysoplasmalogenase [Candidatus Hydrogenedentes bacterium]|nr:lysoplasmalogenase [Candidatus Hydrogenedentota bacterium]
MSDSTMNGTPVGGSAGRFPAGVVCGVLAALSGIGMVIAVHGEAFADGLNRPAVLVASTSYLFIALLQRGLATGYGRLATAGLVFCFLGDMLGPGSFVAGLAMFLVAHLFLVAAFAVRGLSWRWTLGAVVPMLLVSGAVFVWVRPHVPPETLVPVVAYTAVISLMVVGAAGTHGFRPHWVLLIAAIAFYVSDVFVAQWRFVDPVKTNALFCYPVYYTSCVMFAFSVLPEKGPTAAG